jgi:serine/threonine protein kinase
MVVVKVAREALGIRRLGISARTMARVEHPAIQKLVAVGSTSGASWIVTDLADIGTLQDLLVHTDGHPSGLHLSDVLVWLASVADGLAAAHAVGVIHGDVSPSNIFLATRADGRPGALLGDFGSAAIRESEVGEMGVEGMEPAGGHTPRYASPERRRGGRPTEASDTYGLCATALACLDRCAEAPSTRILSVLEDGTAADPARRPAISAVSRRLANR